MFHVKQLELKILSAKELLQDYINLVIKWQKAVNLVSNKEISNLWERHILDSAQLYFYLPTDAKVMVDMGSGGGFPAVVIAILNKILRGNLKEIILVESDNKKAVFLKEVSRQLDLNLIVLNERLENIQNIKADVITSRALGSVELLLEWGRAFYKNGTEFLFLKGSNVENELKNTKFIFKNEKFESSVNKDGCILKITEVKY